MRGVHEGPAGTVAILSLLEKQREQLMLASDDAVDAVGRANQADAMSGNYLTVQGQLDQRIAAVCKQ